jgi:hypothetical protein
VRRVYQLSDASSVNAYWDRLEFVYSAGQPALEGMKISMKSLFPGSGEHPCSSSALVVAAY